MEERYTSLELSRRLAEAGCELKSEYGFYEYECSYQPKTIEIEEGTPQDGDNYHYTFIVNTFDILNDICVKYCKEFFGEDAHRCTKCGSQMDDCSVSYWEYNHLYHSKEILALMQQGKKQEAEDYLWKNCLFFNKNSK